jgi:hypothetical protein
VLEILSGFEAPVLPWPSRTLARINSRFIDVYRAGVFAGVLATGNAPSQVDVVALFPGDQENLRIVLAVPPGGTASAWQSWFSALFALSKSMVPNGGTPALERYLHREPLARALGSAPQDIRDKVDFLLRVGSRDLDGIRREGARLLAGSMQLLDPSFHAYVFVAMTTACLADIPDASCRNVIAQLDRVRRESAVIDVLRAHKAALP